MIDRLILDNLGLFQINSDYAHPKIKLKHKLRVVLFFWAVLRSVHAHSVMRRREPVLFMVLFFEWMPSQRICDRCTLKRNLSRSIKITCFNVISNLTLVRSRDTLSLCSLTCTCHKLSQSCHHNSDDGLVKGYQLKWQIA